MEYESKLHEYSFVELLPNGDTVKRKGYYRKDSIKGGFKIAYDEKDELLKKMKSLEAILVLLHIEERLLKYPKDKLNQTEIVNHFGYSKEFISRTITILVKYNAIMEVSSKRYLWNPYITLGSFDNGSCLQKEWNDIRLTKKYKRRGSDILDAYYAIKIDKRLPELTMEEFIQMVEEKKVILVNAVLKP